MDKFFVAWWGSNNFGEVSEIFKDRKTAGKWLVDKMVEEDVITSNVEGFVTKVDAEYYVVNGKRRA